MDQNTQNDFIYALIETESKMKFYIGRTIHPKQRLTEHRYGAKTYKDGDELKYQYANALNQAGVAWEMEILMECGPNTEFYEDYFINKYRHEPLQNMKAGDSEPWNGRDYSSPEKYLAAKAQSLKPKTRIKTKKVANFTEPLYSFEKPYDRFMSPAMKDILQRRKK